MDDMTLRALQASEIFSSYMSTEENKLRSNIKTAEVIEQEKLDLLNSFEEFQNKVNASVKLKDTFKKLQQVFRNNEKYASTVDPLFVEATLLLKIEE